MRSLPLMLVPHEISLNIALVGYEISIESLHVLDGREERLCHFPFQIIVRQLSRDQSKSVRISNESDFILVFSALMPPLTGSLVRGKNRIIRTPCARIASPPCVYAFGLTSRDIAAGTGQTTSLMGMLSELGSTSILHTGK